MHEVFNRIFQKELRMGLRDNSTQAEYHLWHYLKNKQIGYKFRRQHGIDSFVVDFYCSEKQLAIEIDGAPHFTEEGKRKDMERSKIIGEHGIKIIRFTNDEVLNQTSGVIRIIKEILETQPTRTRLHL